MDMKFEDLTQEQRDKARACKTPEELLALAREEGMELSDAELNGIAGGSWGDTCWTDCEEEGYPCATKGKRKK